MNDNEPADDDKALFEALHRLRVPLSGTDPMSPSWIVITVVGGLLLLYIFTVNK